MDTDKTINAGVEHLAFDLGGQSYAIDISTVREIRGWTEPSGMPNTEPHVMGVINLRGDVLPLLDLASKLGLKTPEINERSVIIVVQAKEVTVGLLVDSVSDIITPADEDMQQPPEAATKSGDCYVSALTLIEDDVIRILDLNALLHSAEQPPLAEAS
ncbi:chemotaxis protein CheW [uncultured Roseobacter sp.]|uniref:chemotaxis protein CheW n=1 Tax=uncultured Roseobacter sp. TaxID=114847 RepID=UPI002605741E|nr:chemotaxis protein CheW [uncultured Roseobacter sp.]